MIQIYRLLSWTCYYLGDLSFKILELFDDSELWVNLWFPIYSKLMCWSSTIQDTSGFDPQTGIDTSEWPWYKADDEENKE